MVQLSVPPPLRKRVVSQTREADSAASHANPSSALERDHTHTCAVSLLGKELPCRLLAVLLLAPAIGLTLGLSI